MLEQHCYHVHVNNIVGPTILFSIVSTVLFCNGEAIRLFMAIEHALKGEPKRHSDVEILAKVLLYLKYYILKNYDIRDNCNC